MLKKSASSVLASFRSSTYPRGYASALHSLRPCWTVFLSILRECSPVVPHMETLEALACQYSCHCLLDSSSKLPHFSPRGHGQTALYYAHRTGTAVSCAFCEQE